VERQNFGIGGDAASLQVVDGSANLERAGQKAQHVAARCPHGFGNRVRHGDARGISHFQRVQAAWHVHHGTGVQERGDRPAVKRRRHDEDPQIVAREPRLLRERDGEIGVNAALMKLVEHDGAKRGEQRILLQTRRQHAFGRDEEPGSRPEPPLVSNVPADLLANAPATLGRDALRDRPSGHAPRLQENQRPGIS